MSILLPMVMLVSVVAGAEVLQEKERMNPPISAENAIAIRMEESKIAISFLSWDTEDGARLATNLLRAPAYVHLFREVEEASSRVTMNVRYTADSLLISAARRDTAEASKMEWVFQFDARVTPTTVLATTWLDNGGFQLPAVLSAPDFGQLMLRVESDVNVMGRLVGSRAHHTVDVILEVQGPQLDKDVVISLTPLRLAAPEGLAETAMWAKARRGWFNALQATSQWGDATNPFSAPAGMLGNNVISDPASCSLVFYADQALWTPTVADGVSVMSMVRRTLDWWLDNKLLPTGEMICYWDKVNFLDANAAPLIAAWDYIEASHDKEWLVRRIERLEFVADYLVKRDIDNDGMIEAVQSGNLGTLHQPHRSCAWWDALNCGHKDAYTNAIIYRSFCCMAELEGLLGRTEQQAMFLQRSRRLKEAYVPALYNPATGWLAWWRSADGELHDYASPTINGLAIEYGLVEPDQAREILSRIRAKIAEVGFTRFDLGVPPMLIPVRRGDYLLPDGAGCPKREDGTDTFGYYMNGGITAGQVLHFLTAHYVVGEPEYADTILNAMLERQARGEFQNGVVDAYPKGIDWTTWDGKPAGYEGYLADSYRFLQAVLLREQGFRDRLYRPMRAK